MKKHLLIMIIVTSSCQWLTYRSDKAALAEHFEIPDDAEMIDYDGFPTMVRFGQREGLTISAKYKLNDEDMKSWIQKVQ